MKRSASARSRLFSTQVMSRRAGSRSSTAMAAEGKSAPSMISAQCMSSPKREMSQPKRSAKQVARNLVQLLAVGS